MTRNDPNTRKQTMYERMCELTNVYEKAETAPHDSETFTVNVEQDFCNQFGSRNRYRFVVRDHTGTTIKSSYPRYYTSWGALRRGNNWVAKHSKR